jgi:FkbM family methyltransferase
VASRFGSHTTAARLARPVVNRLLPEEPTVVTVRAGLNRGARLPLYLRDEKYYWTGVYEDEVQHALASVLRPGTTFWDVGAHIGFFSLLASRLVGHGGRVLAFEPMPANRARLEQALALNAAENVRVDPRAVGAKPAEAVLHRHHLSTMWSLDGAGEGVRVEVTTLDRAAESEGPPNVVKIDVEETALAALQGAREVLQRPGLVLLLETDRSLASSAIRTVVPDCTVEPVGARHQLVRLP